MNQTIIDIETEGLPAAQIAHLAPEFTAPANYKDPTKIAEHVQQQRREWLERTALDPMTGRILVIGMKPVGQPAKVLEGDEKTMLIQFWDAVGYDSTLEKWIGHGIHHFDIPYLIKRSWLHGVRVPFSTVIGESGYVNSRRFVDTMTVFQCGDRRASATSLDKAAKFFGFPAKSEDIGAIFGQVYHENRERAIAYHLNDLAMIEAIAGKMGLLS